MKNENNVIIINENSESNILNDFFLYINKEYTEKGHNEENILIKYKKEPDILKDNSFLISFIEELIKQLKKGNNIIVPFLDPCPNLIKSYIESELDEEKELKYIEVFKLLKINSFINRECLYPIYEYFGELFYVIKDIEDNNQKLKKINKVFELWKIFYDFDKKEISGINSSSLCFIGGGLEIKLSTNFVLDNDSSFIIKINFLKIKEHNMNNKLIIFQIEDNKHPFQLDYNQIEKLSNQKEIKQISLTITLKKIIIEITDKEQGNNFFGKELDKKFNTINKFYLLKNFYGQIKNVAFIQNKKKKDNKPDITKALYEPYILNDNGYLNYKEINDKDNEEKNNKNKIDKLLQYIEKGDINKFLSMKIIDQNLLKVNYINYLDDNFNLYDYFGGFIPFIPFIPLINGIYKNKKINFINGIDKKNIIFRYFREIQFVFFKIVDKYKIKSKIKNKYEFFVYSLILQLDNEIFLNLEKSKNYDESSFFGLSVFANDESIQVFLSNISTTYTNKEAFIVDLKSGIMQYKEKMKENNIKIKRPLYIKTSFKQLFRHIMKELFIYNRFWSNKKYFFKNEKNEYNYNLKYKQISYFTQSFQQPLLYPILEFNKYIPNFSRFLKEKEDKEEKKDIIFNPMFNDPINYSFDYENDIINDMINEDNPLKEEKIKINCCLVKKHYHVKGEIIIKQYDDDKENFDIIFCSNLEGIFITETCNKNKDNISPNKEGTKIINSKNKAICYGSVFPTPKKEYNRKILIKSKDIKFILIRNYYRRTSAIEIFTYKSNKSYYFNFKDIIDLSNLTNNSILKIIDSNVYFKKMKWINKNKKKQKRYIGFYNRKYEYTMFPLFYDEINEWNNKIYYYNNYELLTIINILSNRSFKDFYQYPIFPNLYKPLKILEGKERDLSLHLGLIDLVEKSKIRKDIIIESYYNSVIAKDEPETETETEEECCLFNTHYSNSVYINNYLLRIFPYSFAAIEFQGDGFDSPNRLFYSIKKTLENTLSQKSDLRESIPELYYLPDLFENNNKLELGDLVEGDKVDNLIIEDRNEDKYKKYEFLAESKRYLESLNLNQWIDLIFGKNQKEYKKYKIEDKNDNNVTNEIDLIYYSDDKYIKLDKEKQNKDLTDYITMENFEFGIQPIQLFSEEFPTLKEKNYKLDAIEKYNKDQFFNEHTEIKNDKEICFKCECFNNKNTDYLEKLYYYNNNKKKQKEFQIENLLNNKNSYASFFYYYFFGDVLGNIIIYEKTTKIKNDKQDKKNNNSINENKDNKDIKKFKKLNDHCKQIKYIDYNPRLNLFLSYSLDGFINIYIFPKCKLVRAIRVKDITDSNEILKKVVLVSNPFPMIFTYDINNMYVLTLNGQLIKKKVLKHKNIEIMPCIDKNCCFKDDFIIMVNFDEKGGNSMKKISLPSLSESKENLGSTYEIM